MTWPNDFFFSSNTPLPHIASGTDKRYLHPRVVSSSVRNYLLYANAARKNVKNRHHSSFIGQNPAAMLIKPFPFPLIRTIAGSLSLFCRQHISRNRILAVMPLILAYVLPSLFLSTFPPMRAGPGFSI
jgi:hypothetical protein